MNEANDDLSGRRLGSWRVVRRLGAGGYGTVWEAQHYALPELRVALKVSAGTHGRSEYARAVREARMLSRVDDEHVVGVRDFGVADAHVYLAMDLLEGEDLAQRLRRDGPMPWRDARGLLLQILRGIDALHRVGIMHRDIKPSNCFITRQGTVTRVRLVDLGIARPAQVHGGGERLTQTGCVTGTYEYMAPEYFLRPDDVDERADLYAFGILMFRVLVGRLPFRAPTRELVPAMQVQQPPPRPRRWMPSIPQAVETIILRALAKDPEHRHPDAQALLGAIESVDEDAPAARSADAEDADPTPLDRPPGLRRTVLAPIAMCPGVWA